MDKITLCTVLLLSLMFSLPASGQDDSCETKTCPDEELCCNDIIRGPICYRTNATEWVLNSVCVNKQYLCGCESEQCIEGVCDGACFDGLYYSCCNDVLLQGPNLECGTNITTPQDPACGNGVVEEGEDCDGGACCAANCTLLSSTDGECGTSTTTCGTANCPAGELCCNDITKGPLCYRVNASEWVLNSLCVNDQYLCGCESEQCIEGVCNGACFDGLYYSCCDDVLLQGANLECGSNTTSPQDPACGNGVVEEGEDCDGGACCTADCTFLPATENGECNTCDTVTCPDGELCCNDVLRGPLCYRANDEDWQLNSVCVNNQYLCGCQNSQCVEGVCSGACYDGLSYSCCNDTLHEGTDIDCDGNTTPLLNNPLTFVCGNGIIEGSEQCDGGSCCSSNCAFVAIGTLCQEATDGCNAGYCDGDTAFCPGQDTLCTAVVGEEESSSSSDDSSGVCLSASSMLWLLASAIPAVLLM